MDNVKKLIQKDLLIIIPRKGYLSEFLVYLNRFDSISYTVKNLDVRIEKIIYGKIVIILQLIRNCFKLLKSPSYYRYKNILLDGLLICIPFMLLLKIFPQLKPKEKIIMIHFYLHDLSRNYLIRKILVFLFNEQKVYLNIQSKHEFLWYKQLLPKVNVLYFPYCQNSVVVQPDYKNRGEYIFSGGYSNRDYETLLEVAKEIECDFIIACSKKNGIDKRENLENVKCCYDIGINDFNKLMANSLFVVLPLKNDVGSSGQMVALAAMSLGKVVIYSKLGCINDYFEDGYDSISYAVGDSCDLKNKIHDLLANKEKQVRLGAKARENYYQKFKSDYYYNFLQETILSVQNNARFNEV